MTKQVGNKFTWVIEDFSSLEAKDYYSEPFVISGCKWRVVVYPKGDGVDYLSVYLEVADYESLPSGWSRHSRVHFGIVNQLSKESSKSLKTQQQFNASASNWGFPSALQLIELCQGFLVNDKVIIEVEVEVLEVTGELDVSEELEKASVALLKSEELHAGVEPEHANGPKGDSPCQQEPEIIDASQENSDHAASSPILNGGNGDSSSQWELVQYASETVQNAYAAEAPNILLKEIRPEKEIVDVNGFQVLSSQVELVRQIFERHADIAADFRPKSQQVRSAYMNVLLGLVETLCRPPHELIEDDLSVADNIVIDLTDVGFKIDWLKTKLEEVSLKKKKGESSEARIPELQEELQKLKERMSEVEAELQKEKAEVLAAGVPLSFDDVISCGN